MLPFLVVGCVLSVMGYSTLNLYLFFILLSIQYIYYLALMQGKSLASLASFGKAAGIAIIENARAIRF
jgi:hypothetical protein